MSSGMIQVRNSGKIAATPLGNIGTSSSCCECGPICVYFGVLSRFPGAVQTTILPPGDYHIEYMGGSMKFVPVADTTQGWNVNGCFGCNTNTTPASNVEWRLIDHTALPGDDELFEPPLVVMPALHSLPGYSTEADAETANVGQNTDFSFVGGTINLFLADKPTGDNAYAGLPIGGPTWKVCYDKPYSACDCFGVTTTLSATIDGLTLCPGCVYVGAAVESDYPYYKWDAGSAADGTYCLTLPKPSQPCSFEVRFPISLTAYMNATCVVDEEEDEDSVLIGTELVLRAVRDNASGVWTVTGVVPGLTESVTLFRGSSDPVGDCETAFSVDNEIVGGCGVADGEVVMAFGGTITFTPGAC